MSAEKRFRVFMSADGEACLAAQLWVKNRSLVQAWRDCRRGDWLAFWLYFGKPRDEHQRKHEQQRKLLYELRKLASSSGFGWPFSDGGTPEQRQKFANRIRAHYTPTGKRREVTSAK